MVAARHLGARRWRRLLHRPRRLRDRRQQGPWRRVPVRRRDRARDRPPLLRSGLQRQRGARLHADRRIAAPCAALPRCRTGDRQPREPDHRRLVASPQRLHLHRQARPDADLHVRRDRLGVAREQPHQGLRQRSASTTRAASSSAYGIGFGGAGKRPRSRRAGSSPRGRRRPRSRSSRASAWRHPHGRDPSTSGGTPCKGRSSRRTSARPRASRRRHRLPPLGRRVHARAVDGQRAAGRAG